MKVLNKRQLEIFNLLIEQDDWIPATKVAEKLNISVSTLRRDVESINSFYVRKENRIITKPGLGLKLEIQGTLPSPHGPEDDFVQVQSVLTNRRLVSILTELLSYSPAPFSITYLAEKFSISRSSIVEDLKKIDVWVGRFSLEMIKNHNGTSIEGNDYNIRMALKEIITSSVVSHYQLTDSRIDRFSRSQLIAEFGEKNVSNCISLISFIENELGCIISDPYYTNLFSHLLVSIRRVMNMSDDIDIQHEYIKHQGTEWTVAEKSVQWLSDHYKIAFPAIEVSYIYQYIVSSGGNHNELSQNKPVDLVVMEYTKLLIKNISTLINIDLNGDNELKNQLISHIKPMLNRLMYGITIHNPILEDIKNELATVFDAVKSSVMKIDSVRNSSIPSDDEIAYLTIYIQSAIERTIERKKVILVCSSGVGASQLLSSRIIRTFPEWDIIDIVSGSKLKETLENKTCDLVISTIRLEGMKVPVAYVSALFGKKDVVRVIECLGSINNVKG